jgi:hypothetical protein
VVAAASSIATTVCIGRQKLQANQIEETDELAASQFWRRIINCERGWRNLLAGGVPVYVGEA